MANIIKTVSVQGGNAATSSASYKASSSACGWKYTAADFDGTISCYFEVEMSTDNASYAASCILFDGSSTVANSVTTTTSTTPTRVRSSTAFTPVDGTTYSPKVKVANAAATGTFTAAKIIIYQVGISANTETIIRSAVTGTTTSTVAADLGSNWTYTASEYGGTVTAYFEAILNTNNASGIASAWLSDDSNNLVADSTVTSTSSSANPNPVRSIAITLVNGTTYKTRIKSNNASYTTTLRTSRIIILQTVTALPTVTHVDLTQGVATSSSTTGTSVAKSMYHDDDEWSGVTVTPKLYTFIKTSNASYTTTVDVKDGSSNIVATTTTNGTAYAIVNDTSVTLVDNTEYTAWLKTENAGATASLSEAHLIYMISSNVSSSIKTVNGLAIASVKTVNGLAIASVKTIMGLA